MVRWLVVITSFMLLLLQSVHGQQCTEVKNCASCENRGPECLECPPYAVLSENGLRCEDCPIEHCKMCIREGDGYTCTDCDWNYIKSGDECKLSACPSGQYMDGTSCKACKASNALTCTSTKVILCESDGIDYVKDAASENCLACTGCQKCALVETSPQCTECRRNQYVKDGQCVYCDDDRLCQTCGDGGVCRECRLGSMLQNGKCEYCPVSNCDICSKNQNGKIVCDTCQENYGLNKLREVFCAKCQANCNVCDSWGCQECKTGYVSDINMLCREVHVPSGCDVLVTGSGTMCETCAAGYTMDPENTCIDCTMIGIGGKAHCQTCTSDTAGAIATCHSCVDGYALLDDQSACVSCYSGTTTAIAHCIACNATDANTTIGGSCFGCEAGYVLLDDGSACISCPDNCKECTDNKKCTICSGGYGKDAGGSCVACGGNCNTCNATEGAQRCSSCSAEYYTTDAECVECSDNCLECKYDSDMMICIKCRYSYLLTDGVCLHCPPNCHECTSTTKCDRKKCFTGYARKDSGQCQDCVSLTNISNCAYCKETADAISRVICTQCVSGFTLKDQIQFGDGAECTSGSELQCRGAAIVDRPYQCMSGSCTDDTELTADKLCGRLCYSCGDLASGNYMTFGQCHTNVSGTLHKCPSGFCAVRSLEDENGVETIAGGCLLQTDTCSSQEINCQTTDGKEMCEKCCDTNYCSNDGFLNGLKGRVSSSQPPSPPITSTTSSTTGSGAIDGQKAQAQTAASSGVIIGVVVAAVIGVLIIAAVAGFFVYKKMRRETHEEERPLT